MSTVMLYPFAPWDWHGGTLRLRTAVSACEENGVDIRWWDASAGVWSELDPQAIGRQAPAVPAAPPSRSSRMKRSLFPSTLWESGRRAVAAAAPLLRSMRLGAGDRVIVHTTYLAPLVRVIAQSRASIAVDVHDLVWRAHRIDATGASAGRWAARGAYAAAVRHREERLLRSADRLLVAGYRDYELVRGLGPPAAWSPTGVGARAAHAPPMPPIRIGLIGNFAHSATRDAANALAASRFADAEGAAQLVFAGLGSQEWVDHPAIEVLGPVRDIGEFYDRINLALVPVASGSGMKCKLAEAALAGKAVITTPAGASGYPPRLRRSLHVFQDPLRLSAAQITTIAQAHQPAASRADFDREVGLDAAACTYRRALS